MKPNLIAKFKAVIIGLVILTTFSFNNITEQTTVNAKAKTVMLQKKKQVKKAIKASVIRKNMLIVAKRLRKLSLKCQIKSR